MLEPNDKRLVNELADSHWIGGPGNAFCRAEFTLNEAPRSAILKIVADAHTYAIHHWQVMPLPYKYEQWLVGGSFIKYRVFANDALAMAGPFRPLQDGTPVLHQADITSFLRQGANALAIHSRGETLGFALVLEITTVAGHAITIRSDESWKHLPANEIYRPVCWETPTISQYFKGDPGPGEYFEHIDGRAYPHGWRKAGFDDSSWPAVKSSGQVTQPCEICRTPSYLLQSLKPEKITQLGDGNYLVDFGRAVFGGIELAPPAGGGAVELRLAEELHPDGHARYQLRTGNCYQELWNYPPGSDALSHFGARMFRYAEVVGWTGPFTADTLRATLLGRPFDRDASTLTCSDDRLHRIWQFCKNSIEYTQADVYMDCLTRERLAYEADSYVTMLSQFGVEGSYETARRTIAYLDTHPSWPCEWWQTMIPLFHEYLLHTGDYDFVANHYAYLRDQTSFHPLIRDGLIRQFPKEVNIDWPVSCRDGYQFGEGNAVPNAYAYWDLELLAQLAKWIGKPDEARQFEQLAVELKRGFNAQLFNPDTGLYIDSIGCNHSSLHANLFALRFGLVPPARIPRVIDFILQKDIACSVFTMQYLLETLFMNGHAETALNMITRTGPRSWFEMLEHGAVCTTESWIADKKENMSWGHAWGSSPANVIVRHLFGLRPTAPGWSDYTFDPRPAGLHHGKLSITTPRGRIRAEFELQGDDYRFKIEPEFMTGPDLASNVNRSRRTKTGPLQLSR